MQLTSVVAITAACFCLSFFATHRIIFFPTPPVRSSPPTPQPDKQVWILYFSSWGNFETDGTWINWRILQPDFPNLFFEPPETLPSVHFPQAGLYSSLHPPTVKAHMALIKEAGIDAVIVPWPDGHETKPLKLIHKYANKSGIRVGLLLPESVCNMTGVWPFVDAHPGTTLTREGRPVIVITDLTRDLTAFEGAFIVGTGKKAEAVMEAYEDGVDAIASFYAAVSDSELADTKNWAVLARRLASRGTIFVPTVSPGINETALSVQRTYRARSRRNGDYYRRMWAAAVDSGADVVLVNSFNNWFEGTVIEPVSNNMKFPLNENIWVGTDPHYFIRMTREWSERFRAA